MLKVAISYVSVEQARKNMLAELPGWDFEQVKQASFSEWNDWLGRIEVEGGSREQQIKLYTDLWHALLGRHVVSDAMTLYGYDFRLSAHTANSFRRRWKTFV